MHKNIYASGFLYCPQTQQILLQQLSSQADNAPLTWTTIGGIASATKEPEAIFRTIIQTALKIKLPKENVQSVYDYFNEKYNVPYYAFYAEVDEAFPIKGKSKDMYAWFTLKQLQKLSLTTQAKQDINAAQREIQAKVRKEAASVNEG